MEILLKRKDYTEESTTGELYINGQFEAMTIEDKDRGLMQGMTPQQVAAMKVYGKTAIAKGRYQLVLSYSNRFKVFLPEVLNVTGFAGIRVHAGNTAADSEGCILVGKTRGKNIIYQSRPAMLQLMTKLKYAAQREKIFITIQ